MANWYFPNNCFGNHGHTSLEGNLTSTFEGFKLLFQMSGLHFHSLHWLVVGGITKVPYLQMAH